MSKNTYSIVNVANNEVINVQTSFPPCRDICRSYLTDPENFGSRLQVMKNRTEENPGEVVFDVTSIKYSSGRVRMTLWTEFNRQQKMHEATAAKAARIAEEKKAKAEAKAAAKAAKVEIQSEPQIQEESKAEAPKAKTPKKAAAKKSSKQKSAKSSAAEDISRALGKIMFG
jgi:hypothetical protein